MTAAVFAVYFCRPQGHKKSGRQIHAKSPISPLKDSISWVSGISFPDSKWFNIQPAFKEGDYTLSPKRRVPTYIIWKFFIVRLSLLHLFIQLLIYSTMAWYILHTSDSKLRCFVAQFAPALAIGPCLFDMPSSFWAMPYFLALQNTPGPSWYFSLTSLRISHFSKEA